MSSYKPYISHYKPLDSKRQLTSEQRKLARLKAEFVVKKLNIQPELAFMFYQIVIDIPEPLVISFIERAIYSDNPKKKFVEQCQAYNKG